MKFNCGSGAYKDKSVWHKWFAWYPVSLGPHDCRWLEYVERKIRYGYADDEYCYRPLTRVFD